MNMLKHFALTFAVLFTFAVSAFAQATAYNPPVAKATASATPQTQSAKPTPTPANNTNAQFIVAPKSDGTVQLKLPAQEITAKIPAGILNTGSSQGGTLNQEQIDNALAATQKKVLATAGNAGAAAGAEAGATAGETAAQKYFDNNVKPKLNDHQNVLHGDGTKPGLISSVKNLESAINGNTDEGILGLIPMMKSLNATVGDLKAGQQLLWFALIVIALWVSWLTYRVVSKKNAQQVQQAQPQPGQSGSGGSGSNPVSDPPNGSAPAKPLVLGTPKPATTPVPLTDPKQSPASEPKLNFNRDLTDEESRWFERAQNIWAEYREEGREGNFQRSNLKKRIIDPSKFEALKAAIEREEARIARNVKPAQERPVFKRQPAQADEKPADTQPANEAEANNGDVKTIANPSPNAQAKSAASGTDA